MVKILILLLFISFAGYANEINNSSCIGLFQTENFPVLIIDPIPEKFRALTAGLETARGIVLSIQESKEAKKVNFNEVLYAALPSLLLTLDIIKKGIGGLNGIKLAANYLDMILKNQEDPDLISKVHEDFQKQYLEIKRIRSKKTDDEKWQFINGLKNQYGPKVIRFLQNIIYPEIICRAKEAEAFAGALVGVSGSLGLVLCITSTGKRWMEFTVGVNVGLLAFGTSFKWRSHQLYNKYAGRMRSYWNRDIDPGWDNRRHSEDPPYDYTVMITSRKEKNFQQTAIGLEGVAARTFLYSYIPILPLSRNKKILLQSFFDFENLDIYGFNNK